jgi:hypothetical protein
MGFWGSFVLCKTDQPLDEVEVINARDEGVEWTRAYADGWQVGQYAGTDIVSDAPRLLEDLTELTGAPTLIGFVLDSDCIDVQGFGTASGHFHACIDRECMSGYLQDANMAVEQLYLPPDEAAARAAAWATEASLHPDHDALVHLFTNARCDPTVDKLFFDFIKALGITDHTSTTDEP